MLIRPSCRPARLAALAIAVLLLSPASAYATTVHVPLVIADIPVLSSLGGLVGDVFSGIGHAVLGAFTWTIGLASKFILTTIAALVKMLIPRSWVHKGLQIMQWIVAVPDYAGKVTVPGGGHAYGFAGINALRDVFTWLGVAIAPLTLVYATSRAMIGESDPVGIPLLRMLAVTAIVVSYPYWWAQAAALADQVTHAILSVPAVTDGLYKLMAYAVDGVALGGWQLVDLGLMGAIGLELIGLIFLKVVVILLGALLYATGPLMIGLIPTRVGSALARAWFSAAVALLALGIAWATLFAVGALLIGDAGTAGPLIAGNSAIESLAGGLLLAGAGLASLWLCLKAARELAGVLRLQLSGLLVLGAQRPSASGPAAASVQRTTGQSLREYGSRLARAAGAAGGELALATAGNGTLARTAHAAGYVARRGLVGTAAAGVSRGAVSGAATPAGAVFARSRVGAVAVRMAQAGTASWQAKPSTPRPNTAPAPTRNGKAARRSPASPGATRSSPTTTPERGGAPAAGTANASSSSRRPTRPANHDRTHPSPAAAPRPAPNTQRPGSLPGAGPRSTAPPARQPQPSQPPNGAPSTPPAPRPPALKPPGKPVPPRHPQPQRIPKPPTGDGQ
jgi:hypothetical protein